LTPGNESVRLGDLSQASVPTAVSGGTAPLYDPAPPDRPGLPKDTPLPLDDSAVRVSPFPKESITNGLGLPSFVPPPPRESKPWLPIALAVSVLALIAVCVALVLTRS
jgi:hypothetical protein